MLPPSVFRIPRTPQELENENFRISKSAYQQVSATKDVTGHHFSHGLQQFRFRTSGNTRIEPSKCYFRLRCSLLQVREDGGVPLPLLTHGEVAPNMGLASNLYKSIELQLNGSTLERIAAHLPQVDAFKMRTRESGPWLDNQGSSVNFWDANFAKRRESVAVDGYLSSACHICPTFGPSFPAEQSGFDEAHQFHYNAAKQLFTCVENGAGLIDLRHGPMALRPGDRAIHGQFVLEIDSILDAHHALAHFVGTDENGRNHVHDGNDPPGGIPGWSFQRLRQAYDNQAKNTHQFEIIWRPPLGFFDLEHAIPPGGRWELILTPQNARSYQRLAVESIFGDVRPFQSGRPSLAGDVQFDVNEMHLFVYTMESDRFDRGSWLLDLQHTQCERQLLPNDATSLVTRSFEVHPLTSRLAVAFQDQMAGEDTRYSRSKFKIRPGTRSGER